MDDDAINNSSITSDHSNQSALNSESNIEYPNNQELSSNKKHSSKWQLNVIIILFIVIIIILLLIVYMVNLRSVTSNSKTSANNGIIKKSTNKIAKTTSNKYAGWLTYTNPTYGYSFKYPSNWVINSSRAIPQTANNASASPNTSTVTLTYDGYVFNFQYYITGIGGTSAIVSKVEQIVIDSHNYDLVYFSNLNFNNCQGAPVPGSANYSNNIPSSCKQYVSAIGVSNINNVTANGSESQTFMQINNNTSLIDLKLPQDLLTSTIDNNPEVQTFKEILATIILPR